MAIFAISDLHLAFGVNKPMNVFGQSWDGYEEKIKDNWLEHVSNKDTVIIPGDISWGMTLKEAKKDFAFIEELPGKKIILRGNHDYYFSTVKKLKEFFKENKYNSISILKNNAFEIENYIICGTRGWGKTESSDKKLDKKIIAREEIRLRLSLEEAKKINDRLVKKKEIIVAMHFPPFIGHFCEIMKEYRAKMCIYGHLHGYGHCMIKEGLYEGIEYKMVACDYTKFQLVKLT